MSVEKDVAYGPHDKNKFDIYSPERPNGAAIVVIHGGGWWQGDKGKETKVPEIFAKNGYLVFVPNYRLAKGVDANGAALPENEQKNLYPQQVEDLETFLDFVDGHAEYDFREIGIFGSSAGGNLATELAARDGYAAASWSGLVDFVDFFAKHGDVKPSQKMISASTASDQIDQDGHDDAYYKWCVLNLVGGELSRIPMACALERVNETSGKMFLAASTDEIVHASEVEHLAKKLRENGVEVWTEILPGKRHAEAYFNDAIAPTLDFFAKNLLK